MYVYRWFLDVDLHGVRRASGFVLDKWGGLDKKEGVTDGVNYYSGREVSEFVLDHTRDTRPRNYDVLFGGVLSHHVVKE